MRYLRTLEKIRSFLLSKKSREFLIFLFFVFVSFSFWLLQVLNDDYETELSIPLRMKNVPENVVMTSELPSEVRVGVRDRGTVLVNYLLGQTFYPVTVDFEEYAADQKGGQVRIPAMSLSRRIAGQLNQSTKVSAVKPDTLDFIYTRGKAKKVPVELQGNVKAERPYYISDILFSPESVMVYAPKNILDTITAARTQPVELERIADTTRQRVSFEPIKGAKFVPNFDDLTFLVDVYAEKSVEVSVRGVNCPTDKLLRTFPSRVHVSFQVGLSQFKDITAEDFDVVVDYAKMDGGKEEKCRPILVRAPHNVNHIRITPTEIDYLIEQRIENPITEE